MGSDGRVVFIFGLCRIQKSVKNRIRAKDIVTDTLRVSIVMLLFHFVIYAM